MIFLRDRSLISPCQNLFLPYCSTEWGFQWCRADVQDMDLCKTWIDAANLGRRVRKGRQFTMTFRLSKSRKVKSGHDTFCRRKTLPYLTVLHLSLFSCIPSPSTEERCLPGSTETAREETQGLIETVWKPVYEWNTTKETTLLHTTIRFAALKIF